MKKIFPLLATLLVAASCSNDKPYTISGTIQMPDSLQLGDTVVETPSFEGWKVYMLDLDGTPIDSTEIADNQFGFEGKVDKNNPYFVYLANDICVGMIAVEPGEIKVTIDESSLVACNTPTNDLMTDLDLSIQNMQEEVYGLLADLTEEHGEQLPDSIMMPLYMEFMSNSSQLLDSFYTANEGTLGAQYIVNYITSQVQTSDELLDALSAYPDDIRESQLFKTRLDYLRQVEAYYKMMEEEPEELDTTQLQLVPIE